MFEDDERQSHELSSDPVQRAKEQTEMLRLHAELAAVFEGTRKFGARMIPLNAGAMREIQTQMGRLAKSRSPDSPAISQEHRLQANILLTLHDINELTTNDYYFHGRPGEVMLVRWLEGDEVETFYDRMQAHFEAGLSSFFDDERSANEWKQDQSTGQYLKQLESAKEDMSKRYAREAVSKLNLAVLSTQTADEINIQMIADQMMGIGAEALVGEKSAPHKGAEESELAWFFKLLSLRAKVEDVERMCFFTFLQKTSDEFDFDE